MWFWPEAMGRVAFIHVICTSHHGLHGLTQLELMPGWGMQLNSLPPGPTPSCTFALPLQHLDSWILLLSPLKPPALVWPVICSGQRVPWGRAGFLS